MITEEKLLKLRKLADAMYYAAQYLTTDASRLHKAMEEYHQFIINEYHKEEVSDDLDIAIGEYCSNPDNFITYIDVAFAYRSEQKDDIPLIIKAIKFGANWQKEHLWKSADGDDLPEIDREVVVFTQNFPDDAGMMMVAIGHRPTPEGFDGKSLTTGQVEHYTPKTYGKGGWNIPDVKYWLDCPMPKEIEL